MAIIVTYRDDEVAANPGLELLVGDLATSPLVQRIALQALSESAVRELAAPGGLDGGELTRATGETHSSWSRRSPPGAGFRPRSETRRSRAPGA